MKYCTIPPPLQLARYVQSFWVYEGEASSANPYVYRGFANDCTELVFHYRSTFAQLIDGKTEASFAAGIHAQASTYTRFVVDRNWGIFGCYLYPFVLPHLFSFPASDFTDRNIDFNSVLGREGKELEERMLNAEDNAQRVSIISGFLQSRLDGKKKEEPLVFSSLIHIINTRGLVSVRELAREYSLSDRQFERKFKEYSGLGPKLFTRINRFKSALKEFGSQKSLTDIAYLCGYFDQSHFIKDFKEFSGYNPKVYFSGNAEGSEYLDA